jgi:hypothetical protein
MTQPRIPRRPRALLLLAPAMAWGCGCGGSATASRPADPERARQALHAALDAWKAGQTRDDAARLSPPIRVADEDWLAGLKLVDYRLEPGDRVIGTGLRCPVVLTLRDRRGKARKKPVLYAINTDPTLTVVRQDAP